MELTNNEWSRCTGRQMRQVTVVVIAMAILYMTFLQVARADAPSTTTVQGTVYLANGHVGSGTLSLSWPSFAAANGQAVVAGSVTSTIGPDGFVSVNLAPNLGATPAGLYYTAVFYLSDGTTSTQYWVVPAAAQASLAQVQSQVMPAAQAVQAVSKAYVDQSIAALSQSQITASGGTLNGPLYLSGDPTQGLQAADKHYVDSAVSQANPISVSAGNSGEIAYYTGNGTSIGGMSTIPLASGGTGSDTAEGALQNLQGISSSSTSRQTLAGPLVANSNISINAQAPPYNAVCDWNSVQGKISSGSQTFTAIQSLFTSESVGSAINIPGAGVAGSTLSTTITGYTNGGTVTVAVAASTSTNNSVAYFSPTNSDDTAAINNALQAAGHLDAAHIPTTSYFMGIVNATQGKVIFPYGKVCRVSNAVAVPPGVSVDLNTATIYQTSTTADAMRVSWDDITNRSSLYFYGVAFNSIRNGTIQGPGLSTSTGAGLFLFGAAYGDYENLNIMGFKFGLEAEESGYLTIKHVYTTYNVVGKYLTARGGANGVPVNVTAYAGNTPSAGWVTLTANNGFVVDNVTIAGCNGTNCPTALNGTFQANGNTTMPPACEHGGCTTFTIPVSGVSTSGSGLTGVTATPTGSYFTSDSTLVDDMSDANSKMGLWCQACGSIGVYRGDYSYNGEAEIVLGAQPGYADATHTQFVSAITGSFPSGSGCTANTNQPITISGGTQGSGNISKAQAYAHINSSGQVSGVYVVDGGNGYSVMPNSFSVATCSSQPTLTAVGTSDAGLGVFDGTTNVNRGLITFYSARSEGEIGLPLNGPNTGYAIQINGVGNGGFNAIEFDGFCFGRGADVVPKAYARIARTYGNQISFIDPMCPSTLWDNATNTPNPASTTLTNDVSAFQAIGGTTVNLRLPQSFMANPGLAVVDGNGNIWDVAQPTDGFNAAGLHYSNGFQAGGHDAVGVVVQGNVPRTDAYQRVTLNLSGVLSIGNGSAPQDVGFCRSAAGTLSISDGAIGYVACNANGVLNAASYSVGGVKVVGPNTPNTNIYNYVHNGGIFFVDQNGSSWASIFAKDLQLGGYNTVIPSTVTGYHGTGGTKTQLSDGTGTNGNLVKWASDGSTTDGPTPPAGAIVGTTDTQTLTNKSATTQSPGDNSTKLATTAYVATPGAIAPTTVTATGLVTGANDTTRTTLVTIATTGFTTTGLVLPTVPVSMTKSGRCTIYWQMSSTSYTATFGIGMSNAPTNLWGGASVIYAAAGTSSWLAFMQTATTPTAISTAATAGAANTTYGAELDFTIQTGATNPVAVTLYGEVSNESGTLTVEPGSTCYWLP